MKLENHSLPKELIERLREVQSLAMRERLISSLLRCGLVLIISLMIVYITDRFIDMASEWRLMLLAVVAFIVIAITISSLRVLKKYNSNPEEITKLIQAHFLELGDSLQGAVELADETNRPKNISPELCRAAIAQVEKETRDMVFTQSVSRQPKRSIRRKFVASLLILGALAMVDVHALKSSFWRWSLPLGENSRYTFVQINDFPAQKVVLQGESFHIALGVKASSRFQSDVLSYSFLGQENQYAEVEQDGSIKLDFMGIQKSTRLYLSSLDWRGFIDLKVVHRPSLLDLHGEIEMPRYTQVENQRLKINSGRLRMLEGSQLKLKGLFNNELQEAELIESDKTYELELKGKTLLSSPLILDQLEERNLQLSWRDIYGHEAHQDYELRIHTYEDKAPEVDFTDTLSTMAILETDSLVLSIKARDEDFGIKSVGVQWTKQNISEESRGLIRKYSHALVDLQKAQKEVVTSWRLSPQKLNIPVGYRVVVNAHALDFKPGRSQALSRDIVVFVISQEEHEKIVRRRLEMLQSKLNELASDEQKQLERMKKLRQALDEAIKARDGEALDQLDGALKKLQLTNENQHKKSRKVFTEAEKLIKEAFKNQKFGKEELASWMKSLGRLDESQKQQFTKVAEALKKLSERMRDEKKSRAKQEALASKTKQGTQGASQGKESEVQGSNTPMHYDKIDVAIQGAEKQEEELVRQLKSLSKEKESDQKDDELHNMSRRLYAIHEKEKSIQMEMTQFLPQIIGLKYESLNESLKEAIDEMSHLQDRCIQETNQVMRELKTTYRITRLERYSTVLNQMNQGKAESRVQALGDTLQEMRVGQVIKQSKDLQIDFELWSKELLPEPPKAKSAGGGSSGGAQQDQSLLVELIRVIMEEQDIYRETQYINEHRLDLDLKNEADAVAKLQAENLSALDQLNQLINDKEVSGILQSAGLSMERIVVSLQQQKLSTSLEEQAATIEVLIQIFKPQGSSDGGSSSQQAALNMMRRVLENKRAQRSQTKQKQMANSKVNKTGQQAGTGTNPGGEGQVGELLGGADSDASVNQKEVDRKASLLSGEIPQEYKTALEQYYRKLEESYEE
jgi:hypothetical protein